MSKTIESLPVLVGIGKALDQMRKRRGISLSSLAQECHMSLRDVSHVKKG